MIRQEIFTIQPDRILRISKNSILVLPHRRLLQQIAYYTVLFPNSDIKKRHLNLIPDASGCLVIQFDGKNLDTQYWGPVSHLRQVNNDRRAMPFLILVELRPGGGHGLLGMPMNHLHNATYPLESIDTYFHNAVQSAFERADGNLPVFFEFLDQVFLQRLAQREEKLLVQNIVAQLVASSGNIRMKDLASFIGCTERHISRVCAEYVGMSPKHIARIIRINTACRAIRQSSSSLTELAHLLEFYDQSHFDHEFKAICNVSPSFYVKNMSDFYNDDLKFFPMKEKNAFTQYTQR